MSFDRETKLMGNKRKKKKSMNKRHSIMKSMAKKTENRLTWVFICLFEAHKTKQKCLSLKAFICQHIKFFYFSSFFFFMQYLNKTNDIYPMNPLPVRVFMLSCRHKAFIVPLLFKMIEIVFKWTKLWQNVHWNEKNWRRVKKSSKKFLRENRRRRRTKLNECANALPTWFRNTLKF